MQHVVLEVGSGGFAKAKSVLSRYLPDLSLGLVSIGSTRVLMPASTSLALSIEYGAGNVAAILTKAGASASHTVDDAGAIALLRARDPAQVALRPKARVVSGGFDWHLDKTQVAQAWALFGGPDAIPWGDIRVGHIDTGYTPHPVFGFGATPWIATDLARTFFAPSAPDDDPGPGGGLDPLSGINGGHGTRTASTICGHAPGASGGAFFGVAPKVPLVPVRIANAVWINHAQEQFADAVEHLIDAAAVRVISLSMGIFFSGIRPRLRSAINKAYEAGVIMVCAAGNIVQDVVAPARLRRTLAIGGVGPNLMPWAGSSHGPEVDVSGPADAIRRAEMRKSGPAYVAGGDGTSYATAMTAGAAALWLARHGSQIAQQYPQPWQRVEAFKQLLRDNVKTPAGWQPGSFGTGVLGVHALLAADLPAAAVQPDVRA